MKVKSIEKAKNIEGKTVLVRVDFNVPVNKGKIEDDKRLRAHLPTLKYLMDHDCRLVLITHMGRPKGKQVKKYSLKPIAEELGKLLGTDRKKSQVKHAEKFNKVRFLNTITNDKKIKEAIDGLCRGGGLRADRLRGGSEEQCSGRDPGLCNRTAGNLGGEHGEKSRFGAEAHKEGRAGSGPRCMGVRGGQKCREKEAPDHRYP
mgnify:CR=1 FL=1